MMDGQSSNRSGDEDAVAQEMAKRFLIGEPRLRLSPLGAGLITDTRLVETDSERFVLQRINSAVFTDADAIAENLLRVQDWLNAHARTSVRLPRLMRAASGEATLRDAYGQAWRLLEYIGNSRVIKPLENQVQAAEVGRALGRFHTALAGLDPSRLTLTLPALHDSPSYKQKLDSAVKAARVTAARNAIDASFSRFPGSGMVSLRTVSAEVVAALERIESRAALIPVLQQARAEGTLTPYVTHGDPKVDNVLFAEDEDRALCIVDLDTVQPGLLHQDVADCLRSCCNRSSVADPNGGQPVSDDTIGRVQAHFDLDLCRALLGGYAQLAAPLFDPDAIALLYPAIRLIPLELAIRFLTDYLEGDRYFRVTNPRQNLDKTLIQLALVDDIETKRLAIEGIIRDSFGRRQNTA